MARRSVPQARIAGLAVRVALVTSGLLAAALLLLVIAQAGRILPGTVVAGVDVGGRDPASARRLLTAALAREELRPLAVSHPGGRTLVRPRELGLHLDVQATVDAAFRRGRTGTGAPIERFLAPLRVVALTPRGHVDAAVLEQRLVDLVATVERPASVGDLHVTGDADRVAVVGPHGAIAVDLEASLAVVRAALLDPDTTRVTLVSDAGRPPVARAAIEDLAEQVRTALAGPLVLHHEGRSLAIAPAVSAALLTVVAEDGPDGVRPTIVVDPATLERMLGRRAARTFDRSPRSAHLRTPGAPPAELTARSTVTFAPVAADVELVAETTRTVFVARRTAEQLASMLATGTRRAEADLLVIAPEVTSERYAGGVPTHLLGTFTTFHPPATLRAANIRLLAALLDDRAIAPGDAFSVNATSGPRRCEDGFVPAGTIVRGELVDTCGGGVSQFGTTLLNAAFFAGVPLEQWQPHSFFIGRYPAGREATLTFPELDVRFRNDTDGWIVLRTATTPASITVSLYGIPRWQEVTATHTDTSDPTSFTTVVREADDLAQDEVRVLQPGGDGFTIGVSRTRTPLVEDEPPTVERWRTVYVPQQRIIEVGPGTDPALIPVDGRDGAAPPEAAAAGNGG